MTEDLLYRWPPAAEYRTVVPKTKFYEHGSITPAVREKFVAQVQRIRWAYKLAEASIRLRGHDAVPEIQVFTIDAKDDDVAEDVLAAIDKAVRYPIIFEVNAVAGDRSRTRMVAAHKELSARSTRMGGYFTTAWLPADSPRVPLPPAIDLPGLYAQLLGPLLPYAMRPGESVSEATGRMEQARKLEREIANLEKRLRVEPQLNRKVDLRRELRLRAADLASLTDPAPLRTEEVTWTS